VEATSPAAASRGSATASALGAWGVGMGAVVFIRHIYRGRVGRFRYNGWFSYQVVTFCFLVMCSGCPIYVFFAMVSATVGAVHRSRVVCRRDAVGVRGG